MQTTWWGLISDIADFFFFGWSINSLTLWNKRTIQGR